MKYAKRREYGYNQCVLWRLDDDCNFIDIAYGYINHRTGSVSVYKDHRKIDTLASVLLVPLREVKNLEPSFVRALMADGCITPAEGEKMAVGT